MLLNLYFIMKKEDENENEFDEYDINNDDMEDDFAT